MSYLFYTLVAADVPYNRAQTGSNSSISDLTEAAGWTILDCDGSSADQDIRVVCGDSSLGCDHLYNNGAEYTVVRLPDEVRISSYILPSRFSPRYISAPRCPSRS